MRTFIAVSSVAALVLPLMAQVRDVMGPNAVGTGTITGVVLAAADNSPDVPLGRAVVTVVGGDAPSTRSVITADDGTFAFRSLPAGRYTVVTAKAAYLTAAYGATRPGRPGVPIQLARDQAAAIVIRTARGGVLEGAIRDETGAPIPGLAVSALDPRDLGSPGLTGTKVTAVTDDRGVYRFYGLLPGEYIVSAAVTAAGQGEIERRSSADIDAALAGLQPRGAGRSGAPSPQPVSPEFVGYAATYYPGVTAFAEATPVRVRAGEERLGLDFAAGPVRTGTIAGTVRRDDGQPVERVEMSMVLDGPARFSQDSHPVLSQPPGPSGEFQYTSVPPGRYVILVKASALADAPPPAQNGAPRASMPTGAAVPGWFGRAEVDVTSPGVTNTTITTRPAVTVSGRLHLESTSGRDLAGSEIALELAGPNYQSRAGDGTMFGTVLADGGRAAVKADGTFVIPTVPPGAYIVTIRPALTAPLWLRSVDLNGRDLAGDPLVVDTASISGVDITVTDRQNVLSGSLQAVGGVPAPDYYVVVVPADGRQWHASSRRFVFVRPTTAGTFRLANLPAGDYFLAALTDFDPVDFADDAFLAQFVSQSVKVSIRNGEETVQAIRLAQ